MKKSRQVRGNEYNNSFIGEKRLAAFGLFLAVMVFCITASNVYDAKAPGLALKLFPANGFALASKAQSKLKSEISGLGDQFDPKVSKEVGALSLEAFALEPLNVRAVRNLALRVNTQDGSDAAAPVMNQASRLSRRDLVVNLWLMAYLAKKGEVQEGARQLDYALRVRRNIQQPILESVVRGLPLKENEELIVDLLSENPPWATTFLQVGREQSDRAREVARVVQRARISNELLPRGFETDILRNLVAAKAFREAFALKAYFSGEKSEDRRNLDFRRPIKYPPLDWQLTSTGQTIVNLDHEQGELELDINADRKCQLARQLVQLKEGPYRVTSSITPGSDRNQSLPHIEITCAENEGGRVAKFFYDTSGSIRGKFDPFGACEFYWVSIAWAPRDRNARFSGSVSSVQIDRSR